MTSDPAIARPTSTRRGSIFTACLLDSCSRRSLWRSADAVRSAASVNGNGQTCQWCHDPDRPGPRGDLVGCSEPRRRTFAGIGDATGEPGRSVVATVARRILVVRIVVVVIVI